MSALAVATKPRIAPLKPEARRDNIDAKNVFNIESQSRTATCACGGSCPSCSGKSAIHHEEKNDFSLKSDQSSGVAQKIISSGPPHRIYRSGTASAREAVPASVLASANQAGKPLPQHFRKTTEIFFGANLGDVRIHDDALAAKAASESRAHALTVGQHILLSRHSRDLSRNESQRTWVHEIAHTLQPISNGHSSERFDSDNSHSEVSARNAADTFASNSTEQHATKQQPVRQGIMRERDPRLDELVALIAELSPVLTEQGVADALERAAPRLDLDDPDNYEPLQFLLDDELGAGSGESVLSEWRSIQRNSTASSNSVIPDSPVPRAAVRVPSSRPVSETLVEAPVETRLSSESDYRDPVVSLTTPTSMSGSELEAEIADLRSILGMPALNPDAPESELTDIVDSDAQIRLDRLHALEAEYFDRRGLLEEMRAVTSTIEDYQRESGLSGADAMSLTTSMLNPATAPMLATEAVSALLGHPVEDFATGFLPGFLGGAVLELPRDAFARLDAETREHPILFNGGVLAGIPVGAGEGLVDLIVGLVELLELANDLSAELSPTRMAMRGIEELYNAVTDPEGYEAQRLQQLAQAREIGGEIISLISSMISDPAFMIAHGRELGEIAGRASGQWFNDDYMERSTFDKGYLVGRVEGRILFEIVALFIGPEEWIARGAVAVGEVARLSRPLRAAVIEAIEHIPALRRLLTIGREGGTAARETAAAERLATEAGEVLSDASRASEGASDLGRASTTTDEGARALESVADDGRSMSSRADDAAESARTEPERPASVEARPLNPDDLAQVSPINDETLVFFREHPERLQAWAHNSEATRVCKLCQSPCFPENVTPSQTERLEELVVRARANGTPIEDHALHDSLSAMSETEIERFIEGFEQRVDNPMVDFADREMSLGLDRPDTRVTPEDFSAADEVPTITRIDLAEDHHIATRYRAENAEIFERAGLHIDDDLNLIRDFPEHGQLRGWYDWRRRQYTFHMRGHHPEYNQWITRTFREAVPPGTAPDEAMRRIRIITERFDTLIRNNPEVLSHGPAILPASLRVVTFE